MGMKITYEKGFMVVEHPSGVLSRYSKADIEKWQAGTQADLDELTTVKSNLDLCAAEVSKTAIKEG